MKIVVKSSRWSSWLIAGALLTGCATDKSQSPPETKAAAAPKETTKADRKQLVANPPKIKFGEFKVVALKETEIAEKHRDHKGNQESARKIDGMLLQQLKSMFPEVKVVPKGAEFSKTDVRTLQMTPFIEDIRLISVGTRIWLGAMAGGSDLVMQVTYRDSSTGEVIADPHFWRGNNAWSGGATWGTTDNQVRDAMVQSIVNYTAANK